MTRYASTTEVPVEKSRAEIEKIVRKYGADWFMSGWEGNRATVQFRYQNRYVKFTMNLPGRNETRFTHHQRIVFGARRERATNVGDRLWEQACRQKWRALTLLVKAKLEAVDSKISTFENEFLGNIVLPDGSTVYEATRGPLQIAYETNRPLMLVAPG